MVRFTALFDCKEIGVLGEDVILNCILYYPIRTADEWSKKYVDLNMIQIVIQLLLFFIVFATPEITWPQFDFFAN